jgi:hypothetical protein
MTDLLDRQRRHDYNCAHYAAELWARETGQDIRHILGGFFAAKGERRVDAPAILTFRRIHTPSEPCLVLLRHGKATPHVGVFVRGRVQHLTHIGPIRQPLAVAQIGYRSVRFYAPR